MAEEKTFVEELIENFTVSEDAVNEVKKEKESLEGELSKDFKKLISDAVTKKQQQLMKVKDIASEEGRNIYDSIIKLSDLLKSDANEKSFLSLSEMIEDKKLKKYSKLVDTLKQYSQSEEYVKFVESLPEAAVEIIEAAQTKVKPVEAIKVLFELKGIKTRSNSGDGSKEPKKYTITYDGKTAIATSEHGSFNKAIKELFGEKPFEFKQASITWKWDGENFDPYKKDGSKKGTGIEARLKALEKNFKGLTYKVEPLKED